MIRILIRTSTEDQNPENQLRDCQSINSYGEAIVIKEQQSAWSDKLRPKMIELKKEIRAGKVKHLIVWDFDRLFRNRKKFKDFLKLLVAYDVKLHSYRQQWFEELHKIPAPWNEIVSDLMVNVYGHMAEDESKKKSDRVKIAYKNRTQKWGRKPISKRVEVDVLKLHQEGKSVREIASTIVYWDKSRNQHKISKSAVHKIIQLKKRTTS